MHAVWNAVVKVRFDRFVSITLMTLGMMAASLPVLPFVDFPAPNVWPWIIASVIFHMGYKLALIRAYEAGDMAQTYPLARGTAPLLTTLGAMVLVAEFPTPLSVGGIALLSCGTFLMSLRGGAALEKFNLHAVGYALVTSVFIASYTLSDGSGARLATTASSYAAWLFFCDGVWSLALRSVVAWTGRAAGNRRRLEGRPANRRAVRRCLLDRDVGDDQGADRLGGGAARDLHPVRDGDLVFALREKMTPWRIAAALLIVAGVIALRLG